MLSRVADSLYWMARYLERAEHTARLIDVNLSLMLEQSDAQSRQRVERLLAGLVATLPETISAEDPRQVLQYLTFDKGNPNSILLCVTNARENARQVREQISSEMWEQLNRLYLQMKAASVEQVWKSQPHAFYRSVKEGTHLFQGITDATIAHGQGWSFIRLGASIERAVATARQLDIYYSEFASQGNEHELLTAAEYLEFVGLLRTCSAFEAYCKVYRASFRRDTIAEFILLNREFPRSVRFAFNTVVEDLRLISSQTETHRARELNRIAGRLSSRLDFSRIDEIIDEGLAEFLAGIQNECELIHSLIRDAYIVYPIQGALILQS